jgi:hypothetical protein
MDWVHLSGSGGGIVHLNDGNGGFKATAAWSGLTYLGSDPARQAFADVNGDGVPDWVHFAGGAGGGLVHYATTGSGAGFSDYLQSVANGIGGTTTIAYTPSTQYTNTQLPYPVQVVSSITTNDGNGNVATTPTAAGSITSGSGTSEGSIPSGRPGRKAPTGSRPLPKPDSIKETISRWM